MRPLSDRERDHLHVLVSELAARLESPAALRRRLAMKTEEEEPIGRMTTGFSNPTLYTIVERYSADAAEFKDEAEFDIVAPFEPGVGVGSEITFVGTTVSIITHSGSGSAPREPLARIAERVELFDWETYWSEV